MGAILLLFWIYCFDTVFLSLQEKSWNVADIKAKNGLKTAFFKEFNDIKCKSCGYNYTVEFRRGTKPADQKRLALLMYLEGLGFRSIGRILNVHNTTVYRWIKNFGEQVEMIRNDKPVKTMELDELYTYVGHKKLAKRRKNWP